MRAIDADALIPMIKYATTDSEIGIFPIRIGFDTIVKVINEQPTIEPERKKGEWIPVPVGDCCYRCSECGFIRDAYLLDVGNYCPNCGASMKGEADV